MAGECGLPDLSRTQKGDDRKLADQQTQALQMVLWGYLHHP